MSTYFYQQQQHAHHGAAAHMQQASNNHHGGRSRRGPKMAAQNAQRQFRGVKSMRELAEAPAVTAFRARFEAGRSFDLDDDLEFCPSLLTEDDVTPSISLSPASTNSFVHSGVTGNLNHVNYQQPSAVRTRKVIPIVNPNTGMTLTSPPTSISPASMQNAQRRW
ncbi:hypothetical protein BBP40_012250 [Aspergillus hancockii]|nr:hypothetical protein BBP40_012250 [Aspergillus hancockii]